MSTGRSDFKSVARCESCQLAAKMDNLAFRTASVVTNFRAKLYDRLVHLGLDVFFQNHLAAGEDLLNVRTQLARLRIDDLEFLLDAQSENMVFHTHRSSGKRLYQLRKRLAVAGWRTPDNFPEDAIEMRERLKAHLVGNFANAAIRIEQERFGLFDPHPRQIIGERQTSGTLEQFTKIKCARVYGFCDCGQTDRVALILRDKLFGPRDGWRLNA